MPDQEVQMKQLLLLSILCAAPAFAGGGFLGVDGERFVDAEGRQVLLHGLCVISKSPAEDYQSWHGPEAFADMRDWGMNCIRLGILWDGLEPEPGKYDDEYLAKVDQRIAWAKEQGLYVYLDMHQDLFSVLYSDGAPEWATLSEGKPHITGTVWSDAYLMSPAVQTAFDNFWANTPGPDGVGIQERYALAWQHVAKRYADEPTVIGYDIMNEPFMGSAAAGIQANLLSSAFAEKLLAAFDGEISNTGGLMALWLSTEGRSRIMSLLQDMEIYAAFLDAQTPASQAFERDRLQPMFQRVANAIREVDQKHILLLEPSYHCNAGVPSALVPLTRQDGSRDPLQALAAHGYDIVVDTPDQAKASSDRIALIFQRQGEAAARMEMPLLIGEWGAYGGGGAELLPVARLVTQQFEKLLCGDTYWEYGRGIEKTGTFPALQRPIPIALSGKLLSYHHDAEAGTFTCRWRESASVTAPTRIYLPHPMGSMPRAMRLAPDGSAFTLEDAVPGSRNSVVVFPTLGEDIERSFTVNSEPR